MRVLRTERGGGFTFVELVIALSLLAASLMATIPLVLTSHAVSESIGDMHLARLAARRKVDEIRAVSFDSIIGTYQGQVFQVDADDDGEPDLRPPEGSAGAGAVSIESLAGGPLDAEALRVRVSIRWLAKGAIREFDLVTIRARD